MDLPTDLNLRIHGAVPRQRQEISISERPAPGFDVEVFREHGKQMIDFCADYLASLRDRPAFPKVQPGYMAPMLPDRAPEQPESFEAILNDVQRVILPGVTQWHHPHFHAYYPTALSHPAVIADILSDCIGCIGFTWASSPACTELEMVTMDWLAKELQLPDDFLFLSPGSSRPGKGGGVIQGTASEATLVTMLAARSRAIKRELERRNLLKTENGDKPLSIDRVTAEIMGRLVVYASEQAHCSVERAAMLSAVQFRKVETTEDFEMAGDSLRTAIQHDLAQGYIPFYVILA